MTSKTLLLLAAGLLVPAASLAQTSPQPQAAPAAAPEPAAPAAPEVVAHAPTGVPADGCELHIWPAERMMSTTMGWLGGGLLDAAVHSKRDTSNRTLLGSALDSPGQLHDLLDLDLRSMFKLSPGTTIITHATPVERHTMNKIKTRRADSPSKCYSELVVADLFYQKTIYGRTLRTLFMYRDFENGPEIKFEYKSWGGNGLKLFPPKDGEDATAAFGELNEVFKKDFIEYINNEQKASRPASNS